jgi:hypothetical protein
LTDADIIELEFWQDPVSDRILICSELECSIYVRCWSERGIPADFIGQLSFAGDAAVRSFPREFIPYRVTRSATSKSYILRVSDSDLARDYVDYRKSHYPNHPTKEKTHFVVVGHDIYHEILADSFTAIRIPKTEVRDPRLLRLIADE